MKITVLTVILGFSFICARAQYYLSKNAEVSFFSAAATEDIDAKNILATAVLNTATNEIIIKITNTAFKFKSALMEEHFNENYMESAKYPVSDFKGKINEPVNYTQAGRQEVTITGKLTMHGVTKEVTERIDLEISGKGIKANSTFKLKIADYQIKVPSLYIGKIAEEVEIKVSAVFEPYKK